MLWNSLKTVFLKSAAVHLVRVPTKKLKVRFVLGAKITLWREPE